MAMHALERSTLSSRPTTGSALRRHSQKRGRVSRSAASFPRMLSAQIAHQSRFTPKRRQTTQL
eukprot:5513170-Pleurochrysis_carterae.AAC.1